MLAAWSAAPARGVETVDCWRGWGYLSDPDTQAYASEELLLVTRGAADWRAGLPVALYQLDQFGLIVISSQVLDWRLLWRNQRIACHPI